MLDTVERNDLSLLASHVPVSAIPAIIDAFPDDRGDRRPRITRLRVSDRPSQPEPSIGAGAESPSRPEQRTERERRRVRAQLIGLVSISALVSINVWTGSPLLALWLGSQVQGTFAAPKLEAVAVVVLVLALLVYSSAFVLGWLDARYNALVGRRPRRRQRYPWHESLRAERIAVVRREAGISAIERVLVISVVAAALSFEVWFFFFAGSSLPNS